MRCYGNDLKNLPIYAESTNNLLTFHNICAAIKITVPDLGEDNTCDKIVISADENLAGKVNIVGDDSSENPYKAVILTGEDYDEYLSNELTIYSSTYNFEAGINHGDGSLIDRGQSENRPHD